MVSFSIFKICIVNFTKIKDKIFCDKSQFYVTIVALL